MREKKLASIRKKRRRSFKEYLLIFLAIFFGLGILATIGEWSTNVGVSRPRNGVSSYSSNSKNLIESNEIETPKMKDPVKGWQLPPAWVPKEK